MLVHKLWEKKDLIRWVLNWQLVQYSSFFHFICNYFFSFIIIWQLNLCSIGYKNLKEKYLSNITAVRPHTIDIKAADQSVFKYLESKFQFSEGIIWQSIMHYSSIYIYDRLIHSHYFSSVRDELFLQSYIYYFVRV